MSDNSKTQLGKILLKRKVVSAAELQSVLDEQASTGPPQERLASKVLEKGLSDERHLLKALSEQTGVPAINLDEVEFPLANLELIPRDIAAQHAIVPVVVNEEEIHLAMASPQDQRVIDEIEFVTGKRVFPHVALHAQIVATVEAAYGAADLGEEGNYCGKNAGLAAAAGGEAAGATGTAGSGMILANEDSTSTGGFDLSIDVELPPEELEPAAPEQKAGADSRAASPPPPPTAPEAPPAERKTARQRKRKILVVDDEDDIRLLISRVLSDRGIEVVTAGRGLEAIQKVQTENPDIIILDAMLPEVHGFDICKKIKGSKKYGHIPVIMISAIYRGWRYAQDLKDSYGVDEFIEKPFKIGEFLDRVQTYLEKELEPEPEVEEDLSGEAERILAKGIEAYRTGNIDKAIELLRKGLGIDPLAFKLHYNLGLLLGRKGLNYQAIRELENALELSPDYFPALKNLALLYQKAGFKFKSIETWERALHHCPDDETREGIKQHLMSLL
jgi:DNA-binding response OmpR family regulator